MSSTSATSTGSTTTTTTTSSTTTTTVTVTVDECFKNFRKYIDGEDRSLDIFYKDDESLKKHAPTAKIMVEKLFSLGCKKEIALHLSTLILYDMVMLIGLAPSSVPVSSMANTLIQTTVAPWSPNKGGNALKP